MTDTETKAKAKAKPKTEPTKSEIAKEKRKVNALDKIKADAAEIAKHQKQIDRLTNRMKKSMLSARKNGAKFAEISEIAGHSVGWVQTSLASVGYEPREYNKAE